MKRVLVCFRTRLLRGLHASVGQWDSFDNRDWTGISANRHWTLAVVSNQAEVESLRFMPRFDEVRTHFVEAELAAQVHLYCTKGVELTR